MQNRDDSKEKLVITPPAALLAFSLEPGSGGEEDLQKALAASDLVLAIDDFFSNLRNMLRYEDCDDKETLEMVREMLWRILGEYDLKRFFG